MRRKRQESFDERTVQVDATLKRSMTLTEDDILDGGAVMPGFSLPLKELFAEPDRAAGQ